MWKHFEVFFQWLESSALKAAQTEPKPNSKIFSAEDILFPTKNLISR